MHLGRTAADRRNRLAGAPLVLRQQAGSSRARIQHWAEFHPPETVLLPTGPLFHKTAPG